MTWTEICDVLSIEIGIIIRVGKLYTIKICKCRDFNHLILIKKLKEKTRDLFFFLAILSIQVADSKGLTINIRPLLLIARETYRFLQSPNVKLIDRPSKVYFGDGDVEIVSAASRDLYYPRESFWHTSGGENDGRDSQVAGSRHPSRHSHSRGTREWSSRWALDIFHSIPHARLAEPRVFHYLSREHCSETRVSDRRAKRT